MLPSCHHPHLPQLRLSHSRHSFILPLSIFYINDLPSLTPPCFSQCCSYCLHWGPLDEMMNCFYYLFIIVLFYHISFLELVLTVLFLYTLFINNCYLLSCQTSHNNFPRGINKGIFDLFEISCQHILRQCKM